MKPVLTVIALVIATFAVTAAPASAGVEPAGTGEPLYTNSVQNTQFIAWTVPQGVDAYRLHYYYYRDSVLVTDFTQSVTTSGTGWADWAGIANLEDGKSYAICVQGEMSFPNDSLFFPDGPNSCSMGVTLGRRTATTIDRTVPAISVSLGGGAASTKTGTVGLHIGFQDATAGPFPASFICLKAGADPAAGCTLSYAPACSVPAGASKNTTFDCQVDASALPDGPIGVCVKAADAAIPNNPSNSNQNGSATSANLSAQQCDTIVLDRAAPSVTAGASKVSALTGETITFTAQASDATSGVSGAATWKWADGTGDGSGDTTTHSFAQAGTYVVQARVADAVGNVGVGEVTVTVSAPPADPPPTDPGTQTPTDPAPTNPTPTRSGAHQPHPDRPGHGLALPDPRRAWPEPALRRGQADAARHEEVRAVEEAPPPGSGPDDAAERPPAAQARQARSGRGTAPDLPEVRSLGQAAAPPAEAARGHLRARVLVPAGQRDGSDHGPQEGEVREALLAPEHPAELVDAHLVPRGVERRLGELPVRSLQRRVLLARHVVEAARPRPLPQPVDVVEGQRAAVHPDARRRAVDVVVDPIVALAVAPRLRRAQADA